MDQDPTPLQDNAPTPPPGSGKSGIFQSLNATIAGVTGLVIAIGGLAATWDKIFPANNSEAVAAVSTNQASEAVPVDETAAATATEDAAPEAGDPTLYKGEKLEGGKALTIEWDGKNWILTEGDDSYTYDDLTSEDPNRYEATSGGEYIRWPIEGGEVDESEDRKAWLTYGTVEPVAEQ